MTKGAKSQNPYFEGIRDALLDLVDSLETVKELTSREVIFSGSSQFKRDFERNCLSSLWLSRFYNLLPTNVQ